MISSEQSLTGPVILGIGLGMMSATVPTWQAETSRTHKRGQHVIIVGMSVSVSTGPVSTLMLQIGTGVALSSWITFGFSHISGDMQWKWRVPA